jgi:hypothetical protein
VYQSGVWVEVSTYNRIRDVSTADTLSYGFAIVSSAFNDIRKVQCVKDAWLAEILVSSQSNTNYFEDITAIHGGQIGIDVYQAFGNRFVNVIANNNHGRGITLDRGSSGNVFVNVTVANNSQSGLNLYSPAVNNRFFNVTAANNGNMGLEMFGIPAAGAQQGYPTNNLFMNMNAVNSNYGFNLSVAADGNQFVNTAAANQDVGIYLSGISNSRFSGLLKVGNLTSNCTVSGGTNPGLVTASCANTGTSNATLRTAITASASFAGKVAATDTANGSNINGAAQFQNISDWLSFSTPLRMWGREGTAAFPHASNAGYCGTSGAAENCRIYDWSLALGDTGDAGAPALMGVLSVPTGTRVFGHTLSTGATVTALLNAVEILDGSGNGNGLCESGETCLYTPNIGAYQGHGNLVSAGPFTAGTITGVTLKKYEFNGR